MIKSLKLKKLEIKKNPLKKDEHVTYRTKAEENQRKTLNKQKI